MGGKVDHDVATHRWAQALIGIQGPNAERLTVLEVQHVLHVGAQDCDVDDASSEVIGLAGAVEHEATLLGSDRDGDLFSHGDLVR